MNACVALLQNYVRYSVHACMHASGIFAAVLWCSITGTYVGTDIYDAVKSRQAIINSNANEALSSVYRCTGDAEMLRC